MDLTRMRRDIDDLVQDFGTTAATSRERAEARQKTTQLLMCRESNRLPIKIANGTWEQVEEHWGVTPSYVMDDLFFNVALPAAWRLRPYNHMFWSNLYDAKERLRAGIFYKIDSDDRRAYMNLACRYVVHAESCAASGPHAFLHRSLVTDRIQEQPLVYVTPYEDSYDRARRNAITYLDSTYPDHRNPFAYWTD